MDCAERRLKIEWMRWQEKSDHSGVVVSRTADSPLAAWRVTMDEHCLGHAKEHLSFDITFEHDYPFVCPVLQVHTDDNHPFRHLQWEPSGLNVIFDPGRTTSMAKNRIEVTWNGVLWSPVVTAEDVITLVLSAFSETQPPNGLPSCTMSLGGLTLAHASDETEILS